MVQRFAGLFAALALLSQEAMAQDATAQDRIDLEPASSWVMNYDDDSCALQRQFGPEGQQVFLEIRQFGPGDELQFTAASKDFESRRGPFSVQIEPIDAVPRQNGGLFNVALGEGYAGRLFRLSLAEGEAEYDELYSHFVDTTPVLHEEQRELLHEGRRLWEKLATQDVRSRQRAMREFQKFSMRDDYQIALRRATRVFRQDEGYRHYLERLEAEVAGIGLYDAFERPIYLQTGDLVEAMDAMKVCLEELEAHWGIDVEAHRTLARAAEPYDYDRLAREVMEDYPREMARQRIPAHLRVRLDVSAEGKPTGCHMQSGLNDEAFEREACGNMMRFAQFYPALDAQGMPIRSYYQISVIYVPR